MKFIFALILSVCAISISAQDEAAFSKNELKTNLLNDIIGVVHLNYERLLNEESGVGVHLAALVGRDVSANLTFAPYYRQYFGNKPGAGFFLEGTATFITYDNDLDDEGITAGIGLAFGAKLLTKKDIVFEGYLGITRPFIDGIFSDSDGGGTVIYPRVGVVIGKRF